MSDFLARLLGAGRGGALPLQPRLPSRFAPPDSAGGGTAGFASGSPGLLDPVAPPVGPVGVDRFDLPEDPLAPRSVHGLASRAEPPAAGVREIESAAAATRAEARPTAPLFGVERTRPALASAPISSGQAAMADPERPADPLGVSSAPGARPGSGLRAAAASRPEPASTAAEAPVRSAPRHGLRPAQSEPLRAPRASSADASPPDHRETLRDPATEGDGAHAEDRPVAPPRSSDRAALADPARSVDPRDVSGAPGARPDAGTRIAAASIPRPPSTAAGIPVRRAPLQGLHPAQTEPPSAPADASRPAPRETLRDPAAEGNGAPWPAQVGGVLRAAMPPAEREAAEHARAPHAPPPGSRLLPAADDRGGSAEPTAMHPLAAHAAAHPPATPAEPPVVRISIGRIEVRVTQPPAAAPRPTARPRAGMSLESYLQRREGGAR